MGRTIIKIGLILLFAGCLFEMTYGYFQFVRFFGMCAFLFLGFTSKETELNVWKWIYICSAFLINPFIKISLGRDLWNVVDVVWILILIVNILMEYKAKPQE